MISVEIKRSYISKTLDYKYIIYKFENPENTEMLVKYHNIIEEFERSIIVDPEYEQIRY